MREGMAVYKTVQLADNADYICGSACEPCLKMQVKRGAGQSVAEGCCMTREASGQSVFVQPRCTLMVPL